MNNLESIGFYTLSDQRAKTTSVSSPLMRCELILTDKCNFKCPYCRGLREDIKGEINTTTAIKTIEYWISQDLKNIRFSGGEPILYPELTKLVKMCKDCGVKRIAISTNGSMSLTVYQKLIEAGVNDFSISLDACCSSVGDTMAGVKGAWERVVSNIRDLSRLTYVSVGMVFTKKNIQDCVRNVLFADSLGVSDIRVIPSAQYNIALSKLAELPEEILNKYPILKYRINNIKNKRHVRGIKKSDCNRCPLVLDDMAAVADKHFPCIIYLREGGNPIGEIGENTRQDRLQWFLNTDTHKDPICKKNCLDVCIDYNNKVCETNKSIKQIIGR